MVAVRRFASIYAQPCGVPTVISWETSRLRCEVHDIVPNVQARPLMAPRFLRWSRLFSLVFLYFMLAVGGFAAPPVVFFHAESEPVVFAADEVMAAVAKHGDQPEHR